MIKQAIQPMNKFHGNLENKYKNIDSLHLLESMRCTEKGCHRSKLRPECSNCRLSNIKNIKYFLKNKLEDLKHQAVGYKSHFKNPCFNCSSSFHGSCFEDGHFNLQKMPQVEKECITCERNFTTERSFYHNCNICNALLKNCKLLVDHRRREHKLKEPHQCAACHKSISVGGLNSHIFKHTRPHICTYCNKRYALERSLKWHILSHTGEKPYSCKYCPKQYATKLGLGLHLFLHSDDEKLKCDLCDKTCSTQDLLNRHKSVHLDKLFQCKYCPKKYKSKRYLDIHLLQHTDGKKFKCDLCDKNFGSQYLLKRHSRVHIYVHVKNSFQCEFCPKQYKSKIILDRHQIEHTVGKRFKCDLCGKTYCNQYLLNQHERIHMENLFQCKFCPKQCKTKKTLDRHLLEHTSNGYKKFKCDLCDKTFAKVSMLYRHKFIHTGESFQCTVCSKFFKNHIYLRNHFRRVHTSKNDGKTD